MNKGQKLLVASSILISVVIGNACSKQSGNGGSLTASGIIGTTTPTYVGGGSTTLNVIGNSTILLSQYEGYQVAAASAITLNVNTTRINSIYLGEVNIGFIDTTGLSHTGTFYSGYDTSHGNNLNVLTADTTSGVPTYRFFFEDLMGAIVVTITNSSLGTDTAAATYNGAVYFRNFNAKGSPNPLYQGYTDNYGNYFPPNPNAFCWSGQIVNTPYDCRNGDVGPSSGGDHAFIELGTFTGLPAAALGM